MAFRVIDMTADPRQDHFAYFCGMASPAAGITANVDITDLRAALNGRNFFLSFLWCALRAANAVPELRRRIRGDEVLEYDVCGASFTVLKEDGTYAYCPLPGDLDYVSFLQCGAAAMAAARKSGSIAKEEPLSLIYVSAMPWLSYTQLINPWNGGKDSNPRINWGKWEEREGKTILPLTIVVHHGLADGLHIARFYQGVAWEMARLCQLLEEK